MFPRFKLPILSDSLTFPRRLLTLTAMIVGSEAMIDLLLGFVDIPITGLMVAAGAWARRLFSLRTSKSPSW